MTRAASTAPEPLLVVPLASFTESQQETLIFRIRRFLRTRHKAEIWKPKPKSLHIPIAPRSNYFPQCNPDSKAHIHELAIFLHRLGHSKFLVADGLTLRQLTNDCRYGDEEVLSVVLVNIKSSPGKKSIKSYFQSLSPLVFAERRIIEIENPSDADSYSYSDETWEGDMGSSEEWSGTDTPDEDRDGDDDDDDEMSPQEGLIMGHPRITIDIPSTSAQQILDADRELFTMPTVLSTGRWKFENDVASALPNSLPRELKAEIVAYLDHRITDRNSLGGWDLEWWPGRVDSEHPMVILLAFPTTASQLQRLRNAMAQYMKKIFELIMLKHPPLSERHETLKWTIQLLIRQSQCTPEVMDHGSSFPREEEADDFSYRREKELPLDQFHVQLVPWPYNQPATRRDLEYHYRRAGRFTRHYLLRCPFSTSSDEDLLENSEMATLESHIPRDMAMWLSGKLPRQIVHAVRKSFAGIVREELSKTIQWSDLEPLKPKKFPLYQMICKETLRDPDQPLYDNPPPWIPIWDVEIALVRSRFPAMPLFYLTKRFSDEDVESLENTLWGSFQNVPPKWSPLEILHIPWAKGDDALYLLDGNVHDIWNIFWEITSHSNLSECYLRPLFFLDNQTRRDGTLIVVDKWETWESDFLAGQEDWLKGIEEPLVTGMLYGRIRLESACSFNKSLNDVWGTKTFEQELVSDGIDVMHRYLRPDWPGHGTITDLEG
ncbi:hypothetical protein N7488_007449 [Penicillium malachiteum]|nr:hypothetical protein N7488_007449 [Penicillium malachiteum]